MLAQNVTRLRITGSNPVNAIMAVCLQGLVMRGKLIRFGMVYPACINHCQFATTTAGDMVEMVVKGFRID
ncbi:Uncharacterised protein [Vibrio cholerae]|uniref:Uncharacterized protein n=1 Tax=Vibrio cholerae TaxID=666 RepID=A0A655UTX5_VIBCL|nr:Uncharacterised protein [Vibrio cholerae]CSA24085.1 Uncharacterised protein [Vibrio cholerae]CSB56252.1 Uncharacterised protein [Vibrio cholerae]CSB65381.1 Uncharacterised protein [Vibrio cholerae]CSB69909.1 Uncharacterised protein [Vibrio cholerae]